MKPPKQPRPGADPIPDRQEQMGQRAPDPARPDFVRPGSTSAQLKHDINSGLTGDKVNFFDPAAAPLGTDEEAGGTPPTPEEIHQARMAERSRPMHSPGADSRTPQRGGPHYENVKSNEEAWTEQTETGGAAKWISYLVAAAVIALLLYLVLSS